jgi:hypothetical protein
VLYNPKGTKFPAGIDLLSCWDQPLKDETIKQVKHALLRMEDEEMKGLADKIVEIKSEPGDRPPSPTPSALERERIEKKMDRSQQSCGSCVIL